MAQFEVVLDVPADVHRVWELMVDWPAHGRWVPLTRVTVLTPTGAGVGARFVGRTGIGPFAFDDPMEVVEWQPPTDTEPGRCAVVKQGRLVLGRAWFEVAHRAAPGGAASRVTWTEQIEVAPARLTRPFGPLLAAAGRSGFTRALQAMAREAQELPAGRGGPA